MTSTVFPELVELTQHAGDCERYLDTIYQIYLDEVVNGDLRFLGFPISCQYRPATHGKHFGFWHLISEGEKEDDREINFRRCERIRWIAHMLKNADSKYIKCWENKRKRGSRILLWYEKENYLLVLERRSKYLLLKTAYVHHPNKTRKLKAEQEKNRDPRKAETAT